MSLDILFGFNEVPVTQFKTKLQEIMYVFILLNALVIIINGSKCLEMSGKVYTLYLNDSNGWK